MAKLLIARHQETKIGDSPERNDMNFCRLLRNARRREMANKIVGSFVRIATGIIVSSVLTSAAGLGQAIVVKDRGARRSESVATHQADRDSGIKKRITVEGNTGLNWVNTGLDVSPGDLVRLAATGEVDVKSEWGSHGPEGTTKFSEQPPGYYPVKSNTRYGLSARITSSKGK
jgi:hypothetical protein